MPQADNLLVSTALAAEDTPDTPGWRFIAASEGGARGEARDLDEGLALVIEHPIYAEGSRWEQAVSGPTPGLLLTLAGEAHTQGPCWRRLDADHWMAGGAAITLEAFARDDAGLPKSLGAAEHAFFPPTGPDGVLAQDARMTGAVRLVVPDRADFIVASARLAGEGAVTFSGLTLTAEQADAARLNDELVDALVAAGSIHSPAVEQAFHRVPRHPFLPNVNLARAYEDEAIATHWAPGTELSISSSSQPTMMALMLEQLQVEAGMRVLEIGAGTGYNAALLTQLAGPDNVWTVDVDEEFCDEARAHLEVSRVTSVHVQTADGWDGWPPAAPYDRVIVTASAHDIAPAWADQLRDGGRLVLPWGELQRPQRSLAFRKEGARLVMESTLFCGFMEMRGRDAGAPSASAETGAPWQDWLFPGQPPGDPARLTAYPRGTAPPPGDGEHLIRRRWFDYIAAWG